MLPVSYRKLKNIPTEGAAIFNGKYKSGGIFEPRGVYLPQKPYSKIFKAPILLFLPFNLDLKLESAKHILDKKERTIEKISESKKPRTLTDHFKYLSTQKIYLGKVSTVIYTFYEK